MRAIRLKSYFYLLIVSAIWGVAGPVIKYTLGYFPPYTFLFYRFLMMVAILIPLAIVSKSKFPKHPKAIFFLIMASILGSTINLGLLFWGINYSTVLDQSIISATAPVLIIMAGVKYLHDHVTKREKIGTTIAILGTLFVIIQPYFESLSSYQTNILGNILVFASNLAWVGTIIFSKLALRENVSPTTITATNFAVGLVSIAPFALKEAGSSNNLLLAIKSAPIAGHLGVIYMALLSGIFAYILFQKAQKSIEVSEASLFTYLQPIFAIPVAILWLGEKVTPQFILGSVVVAIGVAIAETKKKRYN